MKDKTGEEIQDHSFDHYYNKFKRARTEDTLTAMYDGAIRKVKKELIGRECFLAQLAIEKALDQCQQDFDKTIHGLARKANYSIKQSQKEDEVYDPNEALRRLLNEV